MFFMKFLQSHWLGEGSCVDLHNDLTIKWLFLFTSTDASKTLLYLD